MRGILKKKPKPFLQFFSKSTTFFLWIEQISGNKALTTMHYDFPVASIRSSKSESIAAHSSSE